MIKTNRRIFLSGLALGLIRTEIERDMRLMGCSGSATKVKSQPLAYTELCALILSAFISSRQITTTKSATVAHSDFYIAREGERKSKSAEEEIDDVVEVRSDDQPSQIP